MKFFIVWFFSLIIATTYAPTGRHNNFLNKFWFGLEASIVVSVLFVGVCALFGDETASGVVASSTKEIARDRRYGSGYNSCHNSIFDDCHNDTVVNIISPNVDSTPDVQVSYSQEDWSQSIVDIFSSDD
jgi:hypothetical protein